MLGIDRARRSPRRASPGAATPLRWAEARTENLLSRFVPFSSLVSPHDVITRGGDYLRVWRLDGVPFECADEHVIAERHEAKCSLLRNLAGGQFALWEHRLHRAIDDSMTLPLAPGFARDLARAYDTLTRRQRMMSNEHYLTLVYRPGARAGTSLQSRRRSRGEIVATHAEALGVMEERSALVERILRGFGPTLLGTVQRGLLRFSEVAEFLSFLVNGQWRKVPMHSGPLYRTLPTARLSFGSDKLEIRNGDERRYAAFVDIHEYADAVEPGVLDALLYEKSEFIETQSFSILPRREAMRSLELQRDQLIASDDVVESQIAEMDVALNELGDGQFCMGEYHYSLLVFGDSVADAGQRAAQAVGAVGEACSLQMRPVDLVADAAWFAQMPRQLAMAPACRQAVVARLRRASQRPQLRPRQARRQSLGRSACRPAHHPAGSRST
jgi:type IV secretion system protein VirB4